jgi:hypothetical protein
MVWRTGTGETVGCCEMVNFGQSAINWRRAGRVILVNGLGSNIMDKIAFNSSVIGRMVLRKERSSK